MLLRCVEIWQTPGVDIAEFEEANTRTTYALGAGLAGEVWQTGEPKWIANLADDANFPNAGIAVKAGMGSAFGVPIKVAGEVLHVLEFFSPKIALPDPELLQTLGAIGSQLGQLIERKANEEALRKSEMRKAAILQSALDCIISFDLDGRITEFNPAAERAFGYSQSEAQGRDVSELIIPEELRENHRRGLAIFNATNITSPALGRRMEWLATRSDGSEFPIEISISRIRFDNKPMFTAYLRDITERKKAEQITSELAAVVENSNDAVVACSLEGIIRSWNAGAERIYGYSTEEAVGQSMTMLLPPDHLDELPLTLTTVRRGESMANYETVRLRKDGKKISVSLTDSPIREGGKITGLSSIARDITERKRLEEELLQSQKMDAVGRLAGGIAHDFNNILTAILGYSDLLIGQIDERQWMYKHLSEIRKAADFAASLTHQLLAFSRRQPLYLRVFNINDTVRNLQKMLQRVIGEHIHIETKLDAKIGRLKADASQLEQVLLNLCVNARDAMPKGGAITIATADVTYFVDDFYSVNEMPAGEYVKLTVTDTGTGISPEIVKHIFEPFFTTKEKGQGTGLGLATCYGIVKQSGGYINVDSTVGAGTSFSIYLPRVEESGQKASIRKEVGQLPGGTETILYVEDEITVRSLTAHVLRRLGYTVYEAGDGKQARDVVEAQNSPKVDLLFSDVVLPDAGGRDLADWIKERNSSTRILFTSGYVDEAILQRHGLEVGTAFLQKPFTPAELARRVRDIIDAEKGVQPV
jgi:PAS domain S-box-containing protein